MFTPFFYLLRARGLKVATDEWFTLLSALERGLHGASLSGFYYLARAVLVKSEADFDKFDLAFLEYFRDVSHADSLPQELLDWLREAIDPVDYDKDAVDARVRGLDLDEIRRMLEQRLGEQKERHDGGSHWVGTGGTSLFGHSGYSPKGIRVGGEGKNRSALQVASERNFRDFREDAALEQRQYQMAFRRLWQFSALTDGPKDELQLEDTIRETCDNAGTLSLVFDRPRRNTVKLMMLFDSGGSMWPYSSLCSMLFKSAHKSNHFKDLKIFYFHNCFYQDLYTGAGCYDSERVDTEWVLNNIKSEYKLIIVGDASMAPSELLRVGGSHDYWRFNEEPGLDWIRRFKKRYEHAIWLNPLSEESWEHGYGSETIRLIKNELPMYRLSVGGLEAGLRRLMASK